MKKIYIELADTYDKREKGLMYRKHLSKDAGMFFRFPHYSNLSFWMKNTYIPLDIAFIDDNGKILQIEGMTPLSTKAICSKQSCKYALEMNRGWFKDNGIDVGHSVGGYGLTALKSKSQTLPPMIAEGTPSGQAPQQEQPKEPNPDVMMNMSNKEKLDKANIKRKDMILIYQTKGGLTLPPKIISPPFRFEKDEDGKHDAIVKAWDNQTGGWKSFLIDNIMVLEEKNT